MVKLSVGLPYIYYSIKIIKTYLLYEQSKSNVKSQVCIYQVKVTVTLTIVLKKQELVVLASNITAI